MKGPVSIQSTSNCPQKFYERTGVNTVGGGWGGGDPKKNQALPYFSDSWARFFLFFFGLLLRKFWRHFNESRLLFL